MQLMFPNGEHASVAFDNGEISIGSRAGQGVSLSGKSAGAAPREPGLRPPRLVAARASRHPRRAPECPADPAHRLVAHRRPGLPEQVQLVLAENSPEVIDRIIPASPPAVLSEAQRVSASRVAIRGISGSLCGRSFTLTEPKVVGRGTGCDIRIDDPALAERECQFELHGDRVVLRSLGHGEFTSVNGVSVGDAVLAPGDQVVIDQHRFVLEAPGLPARGQDRLKGQVQQQHTQTMKAVRVPQSNQSPAEQREALDPPPQPVDPGALWWLIAAAAVLAAAMTALLVYSPHMGAA
jgi:hypothetical protein